MSDEERQTGRLIPVARKLRRDQTDVEAKLWRALRSRQVDGLKFRRQYPIGRRIGDFACVTLKLVVELDGGQHADAAEADAARSDELEAAGWRVLRFWNNAVLEDVDGVIRAIEAEAALIRGERQRP